jgi:hypothetical protein
MGSLNNVILHAKYFKLSAFEKSVLAHVCDPSYSGSENRRITVQASLGINMRTYLKNN